MDRLLEHAETVIEADECDVAGNRFYSDCYVFDMERRGEFIAVRAPFGRSRGLRDVIDLLSWESVERLRASVRSYESRAIAVHTERGLGVILTGLLPASGLGMILIPELPGGVARTLLEREDAPILWDEELSVEREERETHLRHYRAAARALAEEIRMGLALTESVSVLDGEDRQAFLQRRIARWSGFTGCPVQLRWEESAEIPNDLDLPLFDAILPVLLLLARRISSLRFATVGSVCREEKVTLQVRFPLAEPEVTVSEHPELMWLLRLADRHRLCVDYSFSEPFLCINFMPVRYDWSYLGIKEPDAVKGTESDCPPLRTKKFRVFCHLLLTEEGSCDTIDKVNL